MLDQALVEKLKALLLACELDWRDHFSCGEEWDREGWRDKETRQKVLLTSDPYYMCDVDLSEEDLQSLLDAHAKGEPLDRWVEVVRGYEYGCPNCRVDPGPSTHLFECNGLVVRPVEECPYPEGLVTEWELNIPSGRMLIGNDLRFMNQLPDHRNINTRLNTRLQILDYAKIDMAVGFGIGNTSPSVYRMADGSLEIGRKLQRVWRVPKNGVLIPPVEDVLKENKKAWWVTVRPEDRRSLYGDKTITNLPKGCKKVANIATDVGAYSIIDFEEGYKRAKYAGMTEEGWSEFIGRWDIHVVDVEPGKYRFHHFLSVDLDALDVTFSRIERVGEAGPCFDYCSATDNFNVHLTQAVQLYAARYGRSLNAATYANYMPEVYRGWVPERDWHRNGFPNRFLFDEVDGLPVLDEIPRFRGQFYSAMGLSMSIGGLERVCASGLKGDLPLNHSFALGIGRLLESVILYGLKTRITPPKGTYNVKTARDLMRSSVGYWRSLVHHYPHVAEDMEDFAEWMKDEDSVMLWVENFDLGPETC